MYLNTNDTPNRVNELGHQAVIRKELFYFDDIFLNIQYNKNKNIKLFLAHTNIRNNSKKVRCVDSRINNA